MPCSPEAFCFCHEHAHVTANAVSSEAADNGCHTELVQAFHRRLQVRLLKAALTASRRAREHGSQQSQSVGQVRFRSTVPRARAARCRYRAGICDLGQFYHTRVRTSFFRGIRRIDVYVPEIIPFSLTPLKNPMATASESY